MDLYLLRHGIAVDSGTGGYADDSERPLTDEGLKKTRRIAEGLRAFGVGLDWILTSPFVRARQTAEIVAGVFGIEKKLQEFKELASGGSVKRLITDFNAGYGKAKSVMWVGHEPDLSSLVSLLISGSRAAFFEIKKGGCCKVDVQPPLKDEQCATLEWLLTPQQLICLRQT